MLHSMFFLDVLICESDFIKTPFGWVRVNPPVDFCVNLGGGGVGPSSIQTDKKTKG